jgi:hypothetical protein
MMNLYLEEPIGRIIQQEVFKLKISLSEISDRMQIPERKLLDLFNAKSIDVFLLYKWSCFLKIDFFMLYSKCLRENIHGISLESIDK